MLTSSSLGSLFNSPARNSPLVRLCFAEDAQREWKLLVWHSLLSVSPWELWPLRRPSWQLLPCHCLCLGHPQCWGMSKDWKWKETYPGGSSHSFWTLEVSFSSPWARARESFLDLPTPHHTATSGFRVCFVQAGICQREENNLITVGLYLNLVIFSDPPDHILFRILDSCTCIPPRFTIEFSGS